MKKFMPCIIAAFAALAMTWTVQAKAQEMFGGDRFLPQPDHWAYAAISELHAKKILLGYPDGFFHARRAITRYEVAAALKRALDLIGPGNQGVSRSQGFAKVQAEMCKDVAPVNAFYDAVSFLKAKHILVGYPDGLFHGKDVLSRFRFAVVLWRFYSILNLPGPPEPAGTEEKSFKDGIGDWDFYDAIGALHAKQILLGYPDGCFHGKRALTRIEFAVALKRALDFIRQSPKAVAGPPGPQGPSGLTPGTTRNTVLSHAANADVCTTMVAVY